MKKINLVVLVFFCITFYSHSQSKVGIQLAYGTETEFGIGAKVNFGFENAALEISPDVSYYFGKKIDLVDYSVFSINLNAHYRFKKEEKLSFYPLVGLNLAFVSFKKEVFEGIDIKRYPSQKSATAFTPEKNNTDVGINLGIGFNYKVSEQIYTYLEAKYIIGGLEQGVVNIGVLFTL